MTNSKSRIFALVGVMAMLVAVVAPLVASAATITSGTLTLSDSRPSQPSSYTFAGSGFSGTAINCIQLRFAVNADGSGGRPTGINTSGASLAASTLITFGDWTVGSVAGADGTTAAAVRATRATATAPSGGGTGNIVWNGVTNGSGANTTYYGLFNTYTNVDCSTGPIDSTVVAFMYKDGALVTMTVDPTLTFTVAGVADIETVNGADLTVTSQPTTIDFGRTVTASNNGISAHDVTVATNGGGFNLYLRQTGDFSYGANVIEPWSGTNVAPSLISGTGELWAYTTSDSSLAGTTVDRFTNPANSWAGMSQTNQLVADRTSIGEQQFRIGHQLGIETTTPAGNYSTTLVYTAAGTY